MAMGSLSDFLKEAREAEENDRYWELYLHSNSSMPFDEWKEKVANGRRT